MSTKGIKGIELEPSVCTYIDEDGDICNYLGKIKSINKELNNKYIKEMNELHFSIEDAKGRKHSEADNILCNLLLELGYKEIVDEFNKISKLYL